MVRKMSHCLVCSPSCSRTFLKLCGRRGEWRDTRNGCSRSTRSWSVWDASSGDAIRCRGDDRLEERSEEEQKNWKDRVAEGPLARVEERVPCLCSCRSRCERMGGMYDSDHRNVVLLVNHRFRLGLTDMREGYRNKCDRLHARVHHILCVHAVRDLDFRKTGNRKIHCAV